MRDPCSNAPQKIGFECPYVFAEPCIEFHTRAPLTQNMRFPQLFHKIYRVVASHRDYKHEQTRSLRQFCQKCCWLAHSCGIFPCKRPSHALAVLRSFPHRSTCASVERDDAHHTLKAVLRSRHTSYRGASKGGRAGLATSNAKASPQTFLVLFASTGAHWEWVPVCPRLGPFGQRLSGPPANAQGMPATIRRRFLATCFPQT